MVHDSLRTYALCKRTKWTHLPIAGGWYDQHPRLIDDFEIIMRAEDHVEKLNSTKEKTKSPQAAAANTRRARKR